MQVIKIIYKCYIKFRYRALVNEFSLMDLNTTLIEFYEYCFRFLH